ncbi:MAG TPA: hypothetical protein VII92_13785, partial [Anaerolineae bacterium]
MTLLKLAAIAGLVLLAGLGLIYFETATATFTPGTAARPIADTHPAATPQSLSPGIIDTRSPLTSTNAYTAYLPLVVNQFGSQR